MDASKNINTSIITAALENGKDFTVARIIRSYIQKTLLGEVSKKIKVVSKDDRPYISIVLDMDLIKDSFIGISAYCVKDSILDDVQIKQCKLENARFYVSSISKLQIFLPGEETQTELHTLQSILQKIIVKGIPSARSVTIISESRNYKLSIDVSPNGADMGTLWPHGVDKGTLWPHGVDKGTLRHHGAGMGTLQVVMGVPGIKGSETTCNDINEIHHTLGIEATRRCIIDEIKNTISQYGINIDNHYVILLADVLTCKGEVLGNCLKKIRVGVLMLASFEKSEEHRFNAFIDGKEDQIDSVNDCIIMGTPVPLGTDILQVRQRLDRLYELYYGPDSMFA